MLQDQLFTFTKLQTDADDVKTTIIFNPSHPIFEGHFPDRPILPGVCMMQIVKEIAALHLGKKIKLVKAQELKFLSFINPEENGSVQMELSVRTENNDVKIDARLLDDLTTFFKFKGQFVLQ